MQEEDEVVKRQERAKSVVEGLEHLNRISQNAAGHYGELQGGLFRDRRDMLKYLATIASGAAALGPQLYAHIQQTIYFYAGEAALLLCAVVAITYLIATAERETDGLRQAFRRTYEEIELQRNKREAYIEQGDYGHEAFMRHNQEMLDLIRGMEMRDPEPKENVFYKPMDYTTEFLVFFFVTGVFCTALSVTDVQIDTWSVVWLLIGAFVLINVLTTWPMRVFSVLGSPVDLIKACGRFLWKKAAKKNDSGKHEKDAGKEKIC